MNNTLRSPRSRAFTSPSRVLVATIALALLAGGLLATTARRAEPQAIPALTDARHDLDLSFTVSGVVTTLGVTPGQQVKQGDVLVELDTRDSLRRLALAELRAASTIDVEAAKAELDLANNELEGMNDASTRGGASPFELRRKELEAQIARLRHELAVRKQDEAKIELEQVRLVHDKLTLRAPMGGIVESLRVAAGELADPSKPAARLVVIDPLRVYAPTDVAQAARLRAAMPAWVRFTGPGAGDGPTLVKGVIVQVAAVADPGSDTRTVTIELPNPELRPAGLHVEVMFEEP